MASQIQIKKKNLKTNKYEEIISQGIEMKLHSLPEPVKVKMQQLLKTISNKGKSNLIAFVF